MRLEGTGANMRIKLQVSGLYLLRSDEYYEMWFLKGDRRISCGGFTVDSEGRATVTMNAPKAAYAGYPYVVITREESTGNPLPSGTCVAQLRLCGSRLPALWSDTKPRRTPLLSPPFVAPLSGSSRSCV